MFERSLLCDRRCFILDNRTLIIHSAPSCASELLMNKLALTGSVYENSDLFVFFTLELYFCT